MLIRFVVGAVAGSFVNVMVIRGQHNEDYVFSRSRCPKCGHVLEWYDLIPLFSYLFLGGKCRYCKETINIRYLFVEVTGGILGLLSRNLCDFLMFMDLFAIALYDHDTMEIKDSYVIFLLCVALFSFNRSFMKDHLTGTFAISVPMLLITLLFRGFGGGDIKLMTVCGFWLGWDRIIVGFVISCFTASVFSIIQMIRKKQNIKDQIPFAPFLSLGIILGYLYGFRLIDFYETLF